MYTTYSTTSSTSNGTPHGVASAAGSLWYAETPSSPSLPRQYIGNMTTSGTVVADYSVVTSPSLANFSIYSLAAGSDGNIWFVGLVSTSLKVGSLNTTTGAVTYYSTPSSLGYSGLTDLVTGSDGNLWFAVKGSAGAMAPTYIAKVDPIAGTITIGQTVGDYYANVYSLAGPVGSNIWYIDSYYNRIGCAGTSCPSPYSLPTDVESIAVGPDGNIWFSKTGKITKMTSTGTKTEYTLPVGITGGSLFTSGSDNALWFRAHSASGGIGRITTNGHVSIYSLPTGVTNVTGLTWGPNDTPWFSTNYSGGKLVRVSYYQ